jgi:hypothetical protein
LIGPSCAFCAKLAHPAQLIPENPAIYQATLRILRNSWCLQRQFQTFEAKNLSVSCDPSNSLL